MVFVGPSGCGKTTALRMVAGLEDITEGEVRIGDRVVNGLHPRKRDVAMVFQNYALYPHMTRLQEHRLRAQGAEDCRRTRSGGGSRRRRASSASATELERKPGAALRRPAPAGGDGAGDRPRPPGLPDGRAALESRREAARADARRDRADPAGARRDDDLRHARPGRGDDDGRPGRRAAEGRAPAGGRAAAALRPARPTCSSRASSAVPR